VPPAREKNERGLFTYLAVLDILDPIPPFEEQSAGLVDLGDRIVSLSQTHEAQSPNGIRSEAAGEITLVYQLQPYTQLSSSRTDLRPAPTSPNAGACSKMSTFRPARPIAQAAANPPIPPPMMATDRGAFVLFITMVLIVLGGMLLQQVRCSKMSFGHTHRSLIYGRLVCVAFIAEIKFRRKWTGTPPSPSAMPPSRAQPAAQNSSPPTLRQSVAHMLSPPATRSI
jgi:hypothetical protein